jgi:hypothetical protein
MENSICKIHKENNVIHIQFNEHARLKNSNLNEIYEYIDSVYGKSDHLKLIDVRAPLSMDEKVKGSIISQHSKSKMAKQAIFAGKDTNEEIIKIFIEMHSERTPLRIFTDYDNAIEWLTSSDVIINKTF